MGAGSRLDEWICGIRWWKWEVNVYNVWANSIDILSNNIVPINFKFIFLHIDSLITHSSFDKRYTFELYPQITKFSHCYNYENIHLIHSKPKPYIRAMHFPHSQSPAFQLSYANVSPTKLSKQPHVCVSVPAPFTPANPRKHSGSGNPAARTSTCLIPHAHACVFIWAHRHNTYITVRQNKRPRADPTSAMTRLYSPKRQSRGATTPILLLSRFHFAKSRKSPACIYICVSRISGFIFGRWRRQLRAAASVGYLIQR